MLTPDTKRHIDNARQVLVGKVPDPKSQIDQITNALIYKFMDDMDDRAAALGGKRRYFIGDYEKYGWRKLMSESLGAHDRLTLYRQALESMSKNPGIPQLFRDIFRNAYLPFNDPRTLTLFLTEIDYFSYDNSEELGNGYEYLLSVMGSQGDAGQFRTPRHIIDFIVEAVNPTKDDSVLDPACGTAGFLISAYKHVVAKHDGKNDITGVLEQNTEEMRLSADDRKKIYANYHGFDIDDHMVKMARVNMYLHSFPEPHIIEHDSLSSEEHWNERYDVILANPPFMTPKGGIQPHKKFGIEANRAEVLFVDYIATHLKPTGRAGIVVPEGVIASSGKAYRELRKNLIDNYLYAVVSLPAGVFQPYSGVKTSILLLDKQFARTRNEVLFVKLENDGLSLGSQRREVSGNQLPGALHAIEQFRKGKVSQTEFAYTVSRERMIENNEHSFSGDRYKIASYGQDLEYDYVSIEDIVDTVKVGVKIKTSELLKKGVVPVVDQSQKPVAGYTNNKNAIISELPVVAFGDHTRAVKYVDFHFAQGADGIKILKPKNDHQLNTKYLYYIMSHLEMPNKGYSRHWSDVKRIKIPLPPLAIQRELVVELDEYQKIINSAQAITHTYRPIVKVDWKWKKVKLGDHLEVFSGYAFKSELFNTTGVGIPVVRIRDLKPNRTLTFYSGEYDQKYLVNNGDLLIGMDGEFNPVIWQGGRALLNQRVCKLGAFTGILPVYALEILKKELKKIEATTHAVTVKHISTKQIRAIEFNLPPIEIQDKIVSELEAEQILIDGNKKLIDIYQNKVKSTVEEVWHK